MLHRFFRFSKRCRPFSQNGTEHNDKNYGLKTTILGPHYGTEFETFFWLLLYFISISCLVGMFGLNWFIGVFIVWVIDFL